MANITIDLASERLFLITAPAGAALPVMNEVIARCAAAGPVMVLDAANTFDPYEMARQLRGRNANLQQALHNVQISRAFTAYQLLSMLEKTPADSSPKILLHPLVQFRDESIQPAERLRIFTSCLERLRQINQAAPAFVSACPPTGDDPLARRLFAALQETANSILYLKTPPPAPVPLRLF